MTSGMPPARAAEDAICCAVTSPETSLPQDSCGAKRTMNRMYAAKIR